MFNSKSTFEREDNLDEYKKQNIEKSRQQIIKNLEAKKKQQVQECLALFFNNKI